MPANLTQPYRDAEKLYRSAQTPQEEFAALQQMLVALPKHKGTEKMQVDLKQKISRMKKELASAANSTSKTSTTRIPRQGAGRAIIIGGPNAGKSRLLASLTRATPEIANYPFTTREPSPGMMSWEDVYVQLIDSPPISRDVYDPAVQSLLRGADLAILLLDLGSDDGADQLNELLGRINGTKTRLGSKTFLDPDDIGVSYTQTLFVPNKIDLDEADDRYQFFQEILDLSFPEYKISAAKLTGLDELRSAIYEAMDVVRVYTKQPSNKEPDMEKPYTISRGGTLIEIAELIHKDFAKNFKSARVWGSKVHDGTTVKGDYILEDRDIVELQI